MPQERIRVVVTLLIVMVGFALIIGKDDWGKRLATVAAGLILVLSFLPPLLAQSDVSAQPGCGAARSAADTIGNVAVVVLLSGIGLALWRARALLAKRRQAEASRWSSPRDRSPIPPPVDSSRDQEAQQ